MRIFSWLTGKKDHHIKIKRDKRGKFCRLIVRGDEPKGEKMAAPGLSEIVTTILLSRSRKLADNVTENNALMANLRRRGYKH